MNAKRAKAVKILGIILSVLVVSFIGVGIYIYTDISRIWSDYDSDPGAAESADNEIDPEASGLPEASYYAGDVPQLGERDGVTSILLIGVDNRNEGKFGGLSDVMIDLQIDTNNNTIKLASFMRDTLVSIEGHGLNKLNTAYSYGKFELAQQTIKENLGLSVNYYIIINFYGMEDIINALDGVEIDINSNEISNLNQSVDELNKYDNNFKSAHINKSGTQTLNGRQAVAYMRIRHPGGDNGRIERQQKVLAQLFSKAKGISVAQIPGLISAFSDYVRTNIPADKLLSIAKTIKGLENKELQNFRYPDKFINASYNHHSVVQPKDFDEEINKLHDFLTN